MKALPYMNLYVEDYFGATPHLNTEQHGAYLLILLGMWKAGGALPNDPGLLSSLARVEPRRWPAFAKIIMPFFVEIGDGTITQKRLDTEFRKASAFIDKQKAKSSQGVIARALSKKGLHKPRGQPVGQPVGNPPDSSAGTPADNPRVNPVVNPSSTRVLLTKVETLDPPAQSSESPVPQPRASLQRTLGARSLAAASEVVTPTPNRSGAPYPVSAALKATLPRLTHRRPL